MKADNISIQSWVEKIRDGRIRLPEFQREEVWKHSLVSKFLEAVIKDKPLGIFLVLEVDHSNPPFHARSIAEVESGEDKCREHLLDGQQRLVALYRSFKDKHKDNRVFYVFSDNTVEGIKRSPRFPWIGDPKSEFQKQSAIPVAILEPGKEGLEKSLEWQEKATQNPEDSKCLDKRVKHLQDKFSKTIIPFLLMPIDTTPEDAVETFVDVNQSSMRLTALDLAEATYMRENSSALRDLVEDAKEIRGMDTLDKKIGDWILKAACVQQGIKPTNSYKGLKFTDMKRDWDVLRAGIQWTIELLDGEGIWDIHRLPTTVPLRVLPALHKYFDAIKRDKKSRARRLIKGYLWRAFVTDWYSGQANQQLFKDFNFLKDAIENECFEFPQSSLGRPTIFDNDLPGKEELLKAGWPKLSGILGRAVLAVSVRNGARDMETNGKILRDNIASREYHHIFPKILLRKHTKNEDPNLALNCMLLEPRTNKAWGDEWPGDYIIERCAQSGHGSVEVSRMTIKNRLASHFVPIQPIMDATKSSKKSLGRVYQSFLKERAKLISKAIEKLCQGEDL